MDAAMMSRKAVAAGRSPTGTHGQRAQVRLTAALVAALGDVVYVINQRLPDDVIWLDVRELSYADNVLVEWATNQHDRALALLHTGQVVLVQVSTKLGAMLGRRQ